MNNPSVDLLCLDIFHQPYLKLGVRVEDHLGQVSDGASIHHSLSKFRRVFADVAEGRGSNSFQRQLRLLDAQYKQGYCSRIHHCLGQFCAKIHNTDLEYFVVVVVVV